MASRRDSSDFRGRTISSANAERYDANHFAHPRSPGGVLSTRRFPIRREIMRDPSTMLSDRWQER